MKIGLDIPDEVARLLFPEGVPTERVVLESLVAEACRERRITDYQARTLLGLSRYELDGFLKARGVYLDYSVEDLEREVAASERLLAKREAERRAS